MAALALPRLPLPRCAPTCPSARCPRGTRGRTPSSKPRTAHAGSLQLPRPQALRARVVCALGGAEAETPLAPAPTLPGGWGQFSSLVSGEWEGYASDFAADGTALQLPQHAVPEAFRDWGLALFAWQSHSSTLARPDGVVCCRTTRFMPAVGCEVLNPPVFSVQEETFGLHVPHTGILAFTADGSFAGARPGRCTLRAVGAGSGEKAVVRESVDSARVFELEHCLVAQDPSGQGRARVRVVQQYEREGEGAMPSLAALTLFRERWTESGGTSFAEGPPVALDAVEGRWLANKMVAEFPKGEALGPGGGVVEMKAGGTEEISRHLTEEGAIFLPQGVWSRVLPIPGGGVILKAGWLVEPDKAIVSRFDLDCRGVLEGVCISTETRMSSL